MTSSLWAEVVLLIAVFAPLTSVLIVLAVAVDDTDGRWATVGCAASLVAALVLLGGGQRPVVARLAPDDLALAGVAATALLALADGRRDHRAASAVAVSIAACGVAAGTATRPSLVGPVLACAAVAVVLAGFRRPPLVVLGIGAGAALAAVGLRAGEQRGAVLVLAGAAAVATIASTDERRTATLLLPAALVAVLRVAPLVERDTARWVALAAAAGAVVLAAAPIVVRRLDLAPASVLVAWTAAAAVAGVPGMQVAARPLAAGAVLAVALGGPLALVAAVPGAAVLVTTLAGESGGTRAGLAVALLATAGALALQTASEPGARVTRRFDTVPAALAIWFVVRPTAWTWTGIGRLSSYDEGVAIAGAAALATAVALVSRGASLSLAPVLGTVGVRADAVVRPAPARRAAAVVVVTAVMGLIAAALVRSARL